MKNPENKANKEMCSRIYALVVLNLNCNRMVTMLSGIMLHRLYLETEVHYAIPRTFIADNRKYCIHHILLSSVMREKS